MTHDDVLKMVRGSAFNRASYQVNQPINHFNGLRLHCWYDSKSTESTAGELVLHSTPEFQRSSDKWTEAMQVAFVENVLKGNLHNILFFKMNEDDDALVIDGLQRLTALAKFIDGELAVFGGLRYNDFEQSNVLNPIIKRASFVVKIYTFKSWQSVGEFYVEMNENITHSKDDIQKAKDWFLRVHNVVL